jgi:hypothetical protein
MRASTTAGLDSHSLDHRTTVDGIRAITRPGAVGKTLLALSDGLHEKREWANRSWTWEMRS